MNCKASNFHISVLCYSRSPVLLSIPVSLISKIYEVPTKSDKGSPVVMT